METHEWIGMTENELKYLRQFRKIPQHQFLSSSDLTNYIKGIQDLLEEFKKRNPQIKIKHGSESIDIFGHIGFVCVTDEDWNWYYIGRIELVFSGNYTFDTTIPIYDTKLFYPEETIK